MQIMETRGATRRSHSPPLTHTVTQTKDNRLLLLRALHILQQDFEISDAEKENRAALKERALSCSSSVSSPAPAPAPNI